MLKALCTSTPILAFADFTKSFKLHTDAGAIRLGAVMYQEWDEKDRVIVYVSGAVLKSESHYQAHKLEFLILNWAVSQNFWEYLVTPSLYSLITIL